MKTVPVFTLFVSISVLSAIAEDFIRSKPIPTSLLDAPGPGYPGRTLDDRLVVAAPEKTLPAKVIILGVADAPGTILYEKGMTLRSALEGSISLELIESVQLVRNGLRSEVADQDLRDPAREGLPLQKWDIILVQRRPSKAVQ